ncbi:MAG: DUF1819 family protein [Gudongella sp.]|nr:DUF1819 family protein [Gudongella sp.]
MEKTEYSAGMVKFPYWFVEFKKMISMLNEGMTFDEIKKKNLEDNIFSATTEDRAIMTYSTVSKRAKTLNEAYIKLFPELDVTNQKLVLLIAIMKSDVLFFEFMYEVFREKLIMGIDDLEEKDFSIFLKNKQMQSERVAKWKDYTLKRLAGAYKTVLIESGVLENYVDGSRKIKKPIMDISLEELLKENNQGIYLNILQGVR